MKKWEIESKGLEYLAENLPEKRPLNERYKIIIADDDEQIHSISKVMLEHFIFEGKKLTFIDTYSGAQTKKVLEENPDTAVVFLDVVMETSDAGLKVVEYLRNVLKNKYTRIILRTGQPGEAPEEDVIRDFDINDYRLKTEMTVKRLYTSLYVALRSYRDLRNIERHQEGLKKIIQATGHIFKSNSLDEFLMCMLEELSNFRKYDDRDLLYLFEERVEIDKKSGFVSVPENNKHKIIAGTGKFKELIGRPIEEIHDLFEVREFLQNNKIWDSQVHRLKMGVLIANKVNNTAKNYIFIEGEEDILDFDLIDLFLANFSIAVENYILNHMLNFAQREIIIAFAETVESHFDETGSHIKRISEMMYKFALCLNFSYSEAELIRVASTMHDLGKIAISDSIIKKPGKLLECEFEIIRKHPQNGYDILNKAELPALKLAAEIALNHHEKYDGTGYPSMKKENEIPLSARMMTIVDVFDAMTHQRVYKEASTIDETLKYIQDQEGKHFDPELTQLFIKHFNEII